MKSKSRKNLLFLMSAMAGVTAFAAGVAANSVTTSAAAESVFKMVDGAALRASDPTGLRFKTIFDKDYYEKITTTEAELHVAIIPYDYYTAYEDSGAIALYPWLESTYGAGNFLDMEIPDEMIYEVVEDGTTYYGANAVMTNVRMNNYYREFVGVAYVQDGADYEEVTINEAVNARSVMYVADKAWQDETDNAKYGDFLQETLQKGMYSAYGVKYNTQSDCYTYGGINYSFEDLNDVINIENMTLTMRDISVREGTETQLKPSFKFEDGVSYGQDAFYTYEVLDKSVVAVDENGLLTALKAGESKITVRAIGGFYEATCRVEVTEKPTTIISEDIVFTAQGNAGQWSYATGVATFELNVDFNLNDVTKVLCNGQEINFSVDGNKVSLENAPGGDQLYTFVTEDADYVIGGCVYAVGISTAEELNAWRKGGYYGYAVLLNDIDYEGVTLEEVAANQQVTGTLDGRGYSISNFTTTNGFVYGLYAQVAEIKNIAFKNVTQDCATLGSWPSKGVFGLTCNGTIENIYLQVKTINAANDHCAIVANAVAAGASVKNVVLDLSNEDNRGHYAFNSVAGTVEGVVGSYGTTKGASEIVGAWQPNGTGFYNSISAMISAEISDELQTFTSSYWVIDTVNGTIALQPKAKAMLKKEIVNINDTVLLAQGNAGKWSYATGTANVDFSAYGADFSSVEKVLIDGEEFTNYTASGSTLTLTNAAGGDHTITVETPTHIYNATVCVYAVGISTVDELNAWRKGGYYGYAVLLNDIDYEGVTLEEVAANQQVTGTLDGRGYSISNFTTTNGFVYGLYAQVAEIKNIAFKNVTQDCATLGSWPSKGVFGLTCNGTIENIYLQVKTINAANDHCAIVANAVAAGASVKNVVLDLSNEDNRGHYAFNSVAGTVEGVVGSYGTTKGASEFVGGWSPNGTGFYGSISAMIAGEANDELQTFTSYYWSIDTVNGTIAMNPYVCNYVQVAGAISGSNGEAQINLSENGIVGNVDKVSVNGEAADVPVGGNIITLSGLENGKSTVVIITDNGRNAYTLTVKVSEAVEEEEIEKDLIKLHDTYFNEAGSLDLTGSGINVNEITAITVNGSAINYSLSGNIVTVPVQTNGVESEYVISTLTADYVAMVYACEIAISTAEEFVAWATIPTAGGSTINTYAVLANDIVLDGNVISGTSLYNTFDGRGHAIYNLTVIGTKGLFSNLNSGTFKNVQLINFTQDCQNMATTQGLFGDWVGGTVENLLIQGKIINLGANTNNGVLFHFFTGGSYRNIVAYLESDGTGVQKAFGVGGSGTPTVENVYFVSSSNFDMNLSWDAEYGNKSNISRYASEATMVSDVDFSSWETPWTVNSDGAPRMREFSLPQITLATSIYKARFSDGKFHVNVAEFGIKGVGKVAVNGATSNAYEVSGEEIIFTLNEGEYKLSFYTPWAVYHVNARFVDELPSTVINADVVLGQAMNGSATFDLNASAFDSIDVSAIEEVYCNEEAISFTTSGKSLVVTGAPYGDQVYTLRAARNQYILKACVYDNSISTVEELDAWRNDTIAGYTILLNDIDYQGATLAVGVTVSGLLDGRGYAISNFAYTTGFISGINATGAVKNVAFENAVQDCSSLGNWPGKGIFGTSCAGTIENVYLQIKTMNFANDHCAIVVNTVSEGAFVKNVALDISNADGCGHYAFNSVKGLASGVVGSYGSTKGASEVVGVWKANDTGFYNSIGAMVQAEANDELLSFTSQYWYISVADGTISMKSLNDVRIEDVEDGYLVKDGRSAYALVVDSSETSEEYQKAISELQLLFKEATGVSLYTVQESNAIYGMNAKYISLGNTDVVSKAGIAYNLESLGEQGYIICTKGQSIFILGQSQGIQYGVYELLNKILDFEQYTQEIYTLTKTETLEFPTGLYIEETPLIEYRVAFSGAQRADEVSRERMRTQNSEEVFMYNSTYVHNILKDIVPFDTYYSTNPTWFSDQTTNASSANTTQLCYTARGDAAAYSAMKNVALENIKTIILNNPNKSVLPITQMDVKMRWCQCSACQAVIEQYGGAKAATQTLFLNDIVAELEPWLKSNGREDVRFTTFAYVDTETVHTGLTLNERISVWIAPIYDNYLIAPDAEGNQLSSLISSWKEVAPGGVFLWAYGVYFSEYLVSYNTFDQIPALIQACKDNHVEYLWVQGNYNTTQNTGFDSLKAYLISKLMWDNTLDVNELTDNYFNAVFGAAAEAMKTVYTEMKSTLSSMNLSGGINDAPCGFSQWDMNYLETQLGRMESAIAMLDKSDENYQKYYDAIVCESISFRYIYIENTKISYGIGVWGGEEYESTAWGTFEEDVTRLGFTRVGEQKPMADYLA